MGQGSAESEIKSFLGAWPGEEQSMRNRFALFFSELTAIDSVELSFVARPGVSYSMRPKHTQQKERNLFAMVDVIDDDPEARWLSVCFYGDMITDPEERGEVIPGGLSGEDGYCFDMFDDDEGLAHYLVDRLKEAALAAAR
jgi:hypothetical protein